jgi:hypothetical protein
MSSASGSDNGNNSAIGTLSKENDRQRRLIDQTMSMQAALRDWGRTFGTTLACLVLVASLIGVAFAFAGGSNDVISFVGIHAQRATLLGWLAVTTFAVTLIELVLDPRGAARRRAEAVRALAILKNEYRQTMPSEEAVAAARRLSAQYDEVMRSIPEVPDWQFNRLKARHLRKIEISKILSARPGIGPRRARQILRQQLK